MVEAKTAELVEAATAELADVEALGGAFEAIDELKRRLVRSQAERVRRIESGEQKVVGVNCFTETAPSPLTRRRRVENILKVDHRVEAEQIADVERWRAERDDGARAAGARRAAPGGRGRRARAATSWRPPSPWPTPAARRGSGPARCARSSASSGRRPASAAAWAGAATSWRPSGVRTKALAERTGGPPRLLVAKPGLDGHSNGAEQIAVAARDAGFEVIYQGIRLTPAQIVAAARDEDVDIVGLSILSGSHLELVPDVLDRLRAAGSTAAVVVGGIIPPDDAEILLGKGVAAVYTPKDYSLRPHHGGPGRRWPSASAPPLPREARHLAPRHGDGAELNGPEAQALGQVVVVERRPNAGGAGSPAAGCPSAAAMACSSSGSSASRCDQRSARSRTVARWRQSST